MLRRTVSRYRQRCHILSSRRRVYLVRDPHDVPLVAADGSHQSITSLRRTQIYTCSNINRQDYSVSYTPRQHTTSRNSLPTPTHTYLIDSILATISCARGHFLAVTKTALSLPRLIAITGSALLTADRDGLSTVVGAFDIYGEGDSTHNLEKIPTCRALTQRADSTTNFSA